MSIKQRVSCCCRPDHRCSPCSEAERHFDECGELVSRAVCTEASENVILPIAGTQASAMSAGIEFGDRTG